MVTGTKKILSHTADVRIKVTSETLPDLFRTSLQGLNQLLKPNYNPQKFKQTISESIDLESSDRTSLLIDFLSEVLTLSQIHKALFFDVEIKKMSDCKLSAILSGTKIEIFDEDVKAVTYHEADVMVNENGDWETTIIFDI